MAICNGRPLACDYEDTGSIPANPDIAGIGVLVAFISTSVLTLLAIVVGYFMDAIPREWFNRIDLMVIGSVRSTFKARATVSQATASARQKALERFVLGLSDQQLVTGIAVLIIGYSKRCAIDGFHFMILIAMAWFSSTTHLSTLVLLRVIGMIAVCGMLLVGECLLFLTLTYHAPIQCAFYAKALQDTDASCWLAAIVVSLFLVLTYANKITDLYCDVPEGSVVQLVFERFIKRKRSSQTRETDTINQLSHISVDTCSTVLTQLKEIGVMPDFFHKELLDSFLWQVIWLMFGNFYGALQLVTFRSAPPLPTIIGNENEMGFGQLISLLLLILPVMAGVEAYYEIPAERHSSTTSPLPDVTRFSPTRSGYRIFASQPPYHGQCNEEVAVWDGGLSQEASTMRPIRFELPNDDFKSGGLRVYEESIARPNHLSTGILHDISPAPMTRPPIGQEMSTSNTVSDKDSSPRAPLPSPHVSSHHWLDVNGNLYTRPNLVRFFWPMLILLATSLTAFTFLFSGFAMPEDDTFYSYTISFLCLLPFAVLKLNSIPRDFGIG